VNITNPYQHDEIDLCRPRRSLLVVISAGLGSLVALLVLNVVARPPRTSPIAEIELAPAARASAAPVVPVATLPAQTVAMLPAPAVPTVLPAQVAPLPTVPPAPPVPAGPPRWFPPNTPDYVRVAVHDDENLDIVAPVGDGSVSYFSVSARMQTRCGAAVYRITEGSTRELVDASGFLFPRGDGRWLAITSYADNNCRPSSVTVVDTVNATSRLVPAGGWFYLWSTVHARFVMFDYEVGRFTLFDAPSATSLGLGVATPFVRELDERVGPRPADRPGWVMGRVAFLDEGDLVAHIQCQPDACADEDEITGWFYVVDGQVIGESARVPVDKAPPLSFYCGV
jgi:hypothetical protein